MKLFITMAALLAVLTVAASAQPVNCVSNAGVPPLVRADGNAEPVGDLTLFCTGGTPTAAGQVVPQVNFALFLNTNLSSHITQNFMGASFSEALVLVDEPNTLVNPPQRPVLNCGNNGAPDNGVSGPGVCSIISNGNPLQSYDGTGNVSGAVVCDGVGADPAPNSYGCGRPNAFQGRMSSGGSNVVQFLGVPFDPPGLGGSRIFRFTNIRADAAIFGPGGPFPIQADIGVNGSTAITIAPAVQVVGYSLTGQVPSIGSPGVVHVVEGFASAWKARNVAFTLANGTFGGSSYTYNGGTTYPAQAAQNVAGTIYNSEDMFLYNPLTAVPVPNPPPGFGAGPVANLGTPLLSAGLGLTNTGIDQDGSSSAGTRVALTFTKTPAHAGVTVPSMVFLHSSVSPLTNSGVMVLTTTDAAGAGAFAPGATSIPDGGTAVYEILYADPFSIEFVDIPCTPNHSGNGTKVAVSFAPFYSTPGAAFATPSAAHPSPTAVPRFIPASGTMKLQ